MDEYFRALGSVVVHLLDLDLLFLVRGDDRGDQVRHDRSEWNLRNREQRGRSDFDPGADAHLAAAQPIVVIRAIRETARREIRKQQRLPSPKNANAGVQNLVEIVRQHLAREADRDAFHALGKQQRKLHRQGYRFVIALIVDFESRWSSSGLKTASSANLESRASM